MSVQDSFWSIMGVSGIYLQVDNITHGIMQVDIDSLLSSSTCVSMTTKWIPSNLVKPQSTMSV